MKNLKEQYERYFGKLTERARTSDSDVKQFSKNAMNSGFSRSTTYTQTSSRFYQQV